MKKSLFALAMLPAAGALAALGAGTASAATTTTTSAASSIQVMANCDPIWMLSDRAGGNCYDIAFRVGVRCKSTRGDWQVFFSDWHQPRNPATAFCPAGWQTVSADYDLPE